MAEGGDGLWKCNICDLIFKYKSKYDRHKTSLKHKALEGCFKGSTSDVGRDMLPQGEWESITDVYVDDDMPAQVDQVSF